MIKLEQIKRTDPRILRDMANHYSRPGGFVGRNICYAVTFNGTYYGAIVGGSATRFLPGRNEFFSMTINDLDLVINNIFFHIERKDGHYPTRNFAEKVIAEFRATVIDDWRVKYHDDPIGFESLVELPRTGACYLRDGWTLVGQTKGYTCKRIWGTGTDSWTGRRIWDTENLRPKLVFARRTTD